MKCPECQTEITRKQFYDLIYGKDGEQKITCEKCKHTNLVLVCSKKGDVI